MLPVSRGEIKMTQVGNLCYGIWPERPVEAALGLVVRYPSPEGVVLRGRITDITGDHREMTNIVYFENNDWCYVSQISADKD